MKKIMIVEDSALMIAVIGNFIRKSGRQDITICSAKNGADAISTYQAEKPDLVFMDIKMPVMDGITALEEIRKIDPEAKIVMCTSLKEPDQEARAKKAGCAGYIMKPFSREDIVTVVNQHI